MRAILIAVVVIVVVGCGVAYWLRWWHIDTVPSNTNGETGVQLTVDKDKMNKDVNAAKGTIAEDAEKMKEKVHEKGKTQSQGSFVEGTILALDPSSHTLTVRNDKKEEVAVKTDAATQIRVGDKEGTLANLQIGDSVYVSYEVVKGEKTAKSVTVKKRS